MNKIMEELTAARRASGMTQEEMATKADLHRLTVQRAEAGALDPRLSSVLVMARALGMDLMLVPAALRPELEGFVQSGGKLVGQTPGVGAPKSIVDSLLESPNTGRKKS